MSRTIDPPAKHAKALADLAAWVNTHGDDPQSWAMAAAGAMDMLTEANAELARVRVAAAREMYRLGFSTGEIAHALDISRQRVHQLLDA